MKNHMLMAGAVIAALAIPFAANAQSGAEKGAVGGAIGGAIVGGPVGAVVGGVGGFIVLAELLTISARAFALTLCSKTGPPTAMIGM